MADLKSHGGHYGHVLKGVKCVRTLIHNSEQLRILQRPQLVSQHGYAVASPYARTDAYRRFEPPRKMGLIAIA